jgi:predicted transcriptional regulator
MSLYLKYLSHAEEHRLKVDLTAQRLLEIISVCARHEALTVTEAMELHEVASAATLHRKLDDLRKAGLIFHQYEGENRRTKFLYPTQKALNHFSNLSAAMMVAIGEQP